MSLRSELLRAGLMDAPRWGVWRITPAGLQWLEDHPSATHLSPSGEAGGRGRPRRVPGPGGALSFTVQGHRLVLSPEQVTAVAREALASGLPAEATSYHAWAVVVDGQRLGLKWLFQEVTGLDNINTYQARHVLERLGFECVRVKGGGRVARRSSGAAGEEAAWLEVVRREVRTIRELLAGRVPPPSHERVCDMVQFCYTLELYREASSLFRLVDRDSVHPWLYERTRRLAMSSQLAWAGLMESPARGVWRISEKGLEWLVDLMLAELVEWPESGDLRLTQKGHEWLRDLTTAGLIEESASGEMWISEKALEWLRENAPATSLEPGSPTSAGPMRRGTSGSKRRRGARLSQARNEEEARWLEIIEGEVRAVRDFLLGRAPRPSDERLCDLVWLCYLLELYQEVHDLFAVIDRSAADPWLYRRTARLARLSAMKVNE